MIIDALYISHILKPRAAHVVYVVHRIGDDRRVLYIHVTLSNINTRLQIIRIIRIMKENKRAIQVIN